jgi:PAS domain S-box-containing protein
MEGTGTNLLSVPNIKAVVINLRDISERKEAEEKLEKSEKYFKALIEKSYEAIFLVDLEAKILYASNSSKSVLGYETEEFIGMDGLSLVLSEDRKRAMEFLSKVGSQNNASDTTEVRATKKNGDTIWVEVRLTNLIHDPSVNALVVNFRDITESKIIEESLAHEKAEDEALIESIGDGIVATDTEGRIALVNKSFEHMLGWSEKEVLGKKTFDVFKIQDEDGNDLNERERPIALAITNKERSETTYYIVRKDGTKFPALIVANPISLENETIGAIKVFHDMTEEKEIDKAKTEFVSLASHQLRTPLTAINWSIEMLTRESIGPLNPKQKKYLSQVYKASKRMVDLTNSLLTISRLELGKIKVEPSDVDFVDLIKQNLSELKLQIDNKRIHIKEDYKVETPAKLITDPKLLNMIIINLISNAIKYTPNGGRVNIALSKNEHDNFIFMVNDNGY